LQCITEDSSLPSLSSVKVSFWFSKDKNQQKEAKVAKGVLSRQKTVFVAFAAFCKKFFLVRQNKSQQKEAKIAKG